jgi:putative ABC transport system substrate-binding protein
MLVEFRSAEGRNDQLPGLVAELVRRQVAVIVCNVTAASAAKAVTSTVPIVFATGDDPIGEDLVTSLNRPGGNITGVSFLGNALGAKQVELLHELVPKATTIAVLVDTNYQGSVSGLTDVEAAAHSLGQQLIILHASSERDLDIASATLAQQRADAPSQLVMTRPAAALWQTEYPPARTEVCEKCRQWRRSSYTTACMTSSAKPGLRRSPGQSPQL